MLGLRFFILSLLAMVLMVLDHKYHYLNSLRNSLNLAITPIQYAVNAPIQWAAQLPQQLQTRQQLMAQNQALRLEQLHLKSQLQQLQTVLAENQELRALLKSPPRSGEKKSIVAQLLAVNSSDWYQELLIDKGSLEGVYLGQPVIDANGILGQIIQENPLTSRVLLINDPRSAVPVENLRTHTRGLVSGDPGTGQLLLANTAITADVKVGDTLISSGLGGHYPRGYAMGTIEQISNLPSQAFAHIIVKPAADLNRSQLVLLIWPAPLPSQMAKTKVKPSSHPLAVAEHSHEN